MDEVVPDAPWVIDAAFIEKVRAFASCVRSAKVSVEMSSRWARAFRFSSPVHMD